MQMSSHLWRKESTAHLSSGEKCRRADNMFYNGKLLLHTCMLEVVIAKMEITRLINK